MMTLGGLLLAGGVARADDTSKLEGLLDEEVVTTASKTSEQASSAPALARSISAEDLQRFGVRSLAEAIDYLGVGVRTQAGLGKSEIGARGILLSGDRGDHVLLLIDGHRVNDAFFGSASYDQGAGIAFELIDHIEVIVGPGSAIYGSNAVHAVVNVITKSATALNATKITAEASPFSSARATAVGGYTFDVFGKRAELTAGLSYYGQDGPGFDVPRQNVGLDPVSGQPTRFTREGAATGIWGGRIERSSFQQAPSVYARFVRERLEIIARAAQATTGDPSSTADFDQPGTHTTDRRASLSVRQGVALGKNGELSARVYGDVFHHGDYRVVSRASECNFLRTLSCEQKEISTAQRIGAEVQTSFDWWNDGRATSLALASISFDRIASSSEVNDFDDGRSLVPREQTIAGHVRILPAAGIQQTFRPLPWLSISGGARVDAVIDTDGVSPSPPPALAPRIAVATHPWEDATLKAVYAEAFRMPSAYEEDGRGLHLTERGNLRPERTAAKEIIFEQRLGAQRLTLGVFDVKYTDGIVLTVDKAALAAGRESYVYVNESSITTRGFTFAYDGSFLAGRVRLGGSFTGSVAREEETNLEEVAPQVFGNARASYDLGGRLPTLGLATTFSGKSATDHANDGGFAAMPFAPAQLAARATVTGRVPLVDRLSYRVIVSRALHGRTPYGIGPVRHAQAGITSPTLAPAAQWEATFGLSYTF